MKEGIFGSDHSASGILQVQTLAEHFRQETPDENL